MTGSGKNNNPIYTPNPTVTSCPAQMDYLASLVCQRPPTRIYHPPTAKCPTFSCCETYFEGDILGSVR